MEKVFLALQKAIDDLSSGNLQNLVDTGMNGSLTLEEISRALDEYPGRVTAQIINPEKVNIIEYVDNPHAGMIEYDLEVNNVQSDLTLSCEYNTDTSPFIKIENLHVL